MHPCRKTLTSTQCTRTNTAGGAAFGKIKHKAPNETHTHCSALIRSVRAGRSHASFPFFVFNEIPLLKNVRGPQPPPHTHTHIYAHWNPLYTYKQNHTQTCVLFSSDSHSHFYPGLTQKAHGFVEDLKCVSVCVNDYRILYWCNSWINSAIITFSFITYTTTNLPAIFWYKKHMYMHHK